MAVSGPQSGNHQLLGARVAVRLAAFARLRSVNRSCTDQLARAPRIVIGIGSRNGSSEVDNE